MLVYNTTMTEKKPLDSNHLHDAQSMTTVTVYASSSAALKPVYYEAARTTGEVLAEAGMAVVYGAGGRGLMGSVADGALSRNGEVYGVVPQFLQDLELTHRGLTRLHVVPDMHTRKRMMLQDSHAVVTLPGGCGTYEELFEAFTMKRLGQWTGPIVLVNTAGFYDRLIHFLEHSVEERFMGSAHLKMWSVVDHPSQLIEALEGAPAWSSDALHFANVTAENV